MHSDSDNQTKHQAIARRLGLAAIVLLASVAIAACVSSTLPKPAKKDRGVKVNHQLHAEQGLDCATCHEAQEGGKISFPTHETCSVCHDINMDQPTAEMCNKCHTRGDDYGVTPLETRLKPELKWSHEPHAAKEVACDKCHGADPDTQGLPSGSLKPMCMDCHGKTDPKLNECSVCHNEMSDKVVPMFRGQSRIQHDVPAIWAHTHGSEARVDPKFCSMCHTEQNFCDTCHATQAPQDHTPTWRRKAHGIEAGYNRNKCSVCHEEDSCLQCHKNTTPESHKAAWGAPVNNHCTSCHYPATKDNCTVCHESVQHITAPPSPHRALIYPPNCRRCHPGSTPGRAPHAVNTTVGCKFCH
ncbi:MAG: hypothetical protein IT366_14280 [Candidatus Hydrogenedentes bacterium]|nr:hypothetical protein [Candidatus Hydrogenedentota bacterium]